MYEINKKNKIDGLILLSEIKDKTISTAFFDPQYRGRSRQTQIWKRGAGER